MKFQTLTLCSLVFTAPFAWGFTVPLAARSNVLANGNGAARDIPSPPHWVIYTDESNDAPPSTETIDGYNVFILSFLMLKGASDQASTWESLSASKRASIKSSYAKAGIKLLVSAFGSEDTPTTSGANPTDTAHTMAAWVKKYGLDGIDVDYEDFDAVDKGSADAWLTTFTKQLRSQLPASDYIITHAPIAPWFGHGGPYVTVNKNVGDLIDWYNVQFYNQDSSYTSCTTLLTKSGGQFPETSVFEIHSSAGVELNKIVIGKPGKSSDADSGQGYISPSTLASCVSQAKKNGWSAGVMVWEFPDAAASWIKTVRSGSWPV